MSGARSCRPARPFPLRPPRSLTPRVRAPRCARESTCVIVSYNGSVDLAQPRPCVAVFGGDRSDAGYGPDVALFPGTEADKKRLCASLKQGSFRYLVLLTRWMSHNQRDAVREAAAGRAQVIYWTRGHGALGEYLPELLRTPATQEGAAAGAAAALPSAEEAARNAGFTLSCFEQRHEACEYREAEQVRCGCSCHPLVNEESEVPLEPRSAEGAVGPSTATSSPARSRIENEADAQHPVQPVPARTPKAGPRSTASARFVCTPPTVLEALSVDPARQWTVAEIGDLLLAKTASQHMSVHRCVTSMLRQGALALAHAGSGTKKDPRRVGLLNPAQVSTSTQARSPPAPQAGPLFLVLDEYSRVLLSSHEKSEVLDRLASLPSARLFREVRTRVRVEIEE